MLVHGPNAWACAIRNDGGELEVAGEVKRLRCESGQPPLLRGPARIAEVFALLPADPASRLPQARLPFQRPVVIASMLGTAAVTVRMIKGSRSLTPLARELLGGLLSALPAALALRGSELAAYHGAEHISIGSYEHGAPREREHERCGSHMLGPLLASFRGRRRARHAGPASSLRGAGARGGQLGALAAATEIFGWMVAQPGAPACARPGPARPRAPAPLRTAEPTPEQLEVAEAALASVPRARARSPWRRTRTEASLAMPTSGRACFACASV